MKSIIVLLFSPVLLSSLIAVKPAFAQRRTPEQCYVLHLQAAQVIDANSPPLGSYAYSYFLLNKVQPYLIGLQRKYPECDFWNPNRPRSRHHEFQQQHMQQKIERSRRELERIQQERIQESMKVFEMLE